MRLHSLTLREIHLPLISPFETSMDRVTDRRILLVEAAVDGIAGWGECTAGENPFYSPEDTDTAWHIITTYLWPMLKGKEFASAADVWSLLAQIRGHNMAKAAVETAHLGRRSQTQKSPALETSRWHARGDPLRGFHRRKRFSRRTFRHRQKRISRRLPAHQN